MKLIDKELRFYCFVNYYLSPIQHGIQTGHCAVDLVVQYMNSSNQYHRELVMDWAENDKTFIILNGGDAESIAAATGIIQRSGFPCATFNESARALGAIQTCVGVILPEEIFNAKFDRDLTEAAFGRKCYSWDSKNDKKIIYSEGHHHYEIIDLLRSSRLA